MKGSSILPVPLFALSLSGLLPKNTMLAAQECRLARKTRRCRVYGAQGDARAGSGSRGLQAHGLNCQAFR